MECNGIPENTAVSGIRPSFPKQRHRGWFWKNWIIEYEDAANRLPVEMAEFHLAINVRAAEALGLDISDEILLQADIIIR